MPRVLIIGAGPSGCSVLRAFKTAETNGSSIPEVVCYEKQATQGGLWNYNWRTGQDGTEQCHNSMYRHLWSNGPKECLEFSDYHFEEHFGKAIPSYPPREVLHDYISGRIKKAGVLPWIKFNTSVRDCQYDAATGKFTVRAADVNTEVETTEVFDYVICCSGHFSVPNVPSFDGMATAACRIMHAHDFRNAEEFTNQRILIVGTSYSAEDIASQCYKYKCKSIHLAYRTAPMGFHWPDNFHQVKGNLASIDGKKVMFTDNTSTEVDIVILCTGYKHHFPFMAPDIRLKTANRLWCDDLYEGVVLPSNPKVFYIGMQDQWFTFNMFDAQAWYARDVIMGKIRLPSKKEMELSWAQWRKAEEAIEATDEANIRYQADYTKRMIEYTDYKMFNIEGVVQCFLEWEHNKHENIMTFRDKPHTSLMTGTTAPVHHTPWLRAFDDSIECYVEQAKPAKSKLCTSDDASSMSRLLTGGLAVLLAAGCAIAVIKAKQRVG